MTDKRFITAGRAIVAENDPVSYCLVEIDEDQYARIKQMQEDVRQLVNERGYGDTDLRLSVFFYAARFFESYIPKVEFTHFDPDFVTYEADMDCEGAGRDLDNVIKRLVDDEVIRDDDDEDNETRTDCDRIQVHADDEIHFEACSKYGSGDFQSFLIKIADLDKFFGGDDG